LNAVLLRKSFKKKKISNLYLNAKMATNLYEKKFLLKLTGTRRSPHVISDLWYDKSIEMVLFCNQMLDYGM
jgi:hypothetical protein